MTKIKTSELTGAALDWAVATCEGENAAVSGGKCVEANDLWPYEFSYSTDWSWGGRIIGREDITCGPWDTSPAMAHKGTTVGNGNDRWVGPTPLIAAMRCYVASKLGDTVDVPEELLS